MFHRANKSGTLLLHIWFIRLKWRANTRAIATGRWILTSPHDDIGQYLMYRYVGTHTASSGRTLCFLCTELIQYLYKKSIEKCFELRKVTEQLFLEKCRHNPCIQTRKGHNSSLRKGALIFVRTRSRFGYCGQRHALASLSTCLVMPSTIVGSNNVIAAKLSRASRW